jgi:hypothetical protein
MLLASSLWIYPQPVVSKTKISLHEAHSIKQDVNDPYGLTPVQNNQATRPDATGNRATKQTTKASSKTSATPLVKAREYSGRHYSKEEVQALIIQYSQQYGINPAVPLCIARLESGYNQFSKNKSSSASGVFQYLTGTFAQTDEGKSGLSVFDADANVKAAIKYMASRKSVKPWVVARKCPSL